MHALVRKSSLSTAHGSVKPAAGDVCLLYNLAKVTLKFVLTIGRRCPGTDLGCAHVHLCTSHGLQCCMGLGREAGGGGGARGVDEGRW